MYYHNIQHHKTLTGTDPSYNHPILSNLEGTLKIQIDPLQHVHIGPIRSIQKRWFQDSHKNKDLNKYIQCHRSNVSSLDILHEKSPSQKHTATTFFKKHLRIFTLRVQRPGSCCCTLGNGYLFCGSRRKQNRCAKRLYRNGRSHRYMYTATVKHGRRGKLECV